MGLATTRLARIAPSKMPDSVALNKGCDEALSSKLRQSSPSAADFDYELHANFDLHDGSAYISQAKRRMLLGLIVFQPYYPPRHSAVSCASTRHARLRACNAMPCGWPRRLDAFAFPPACWPWRRRRAWRKSCSARWVSLSTLICTAKGSQPSHSTGLTKSPTM